MIEIPDGLVHWRQRPGGAAWLASLPAIVESCSQQWEVVPGPPFEPASVSLVLPVTMRDGTPAVLKVNFPEWESEREPDALAHWDGKGAVRLLASDPNQRALLIERCQPGTQLWELEEAGEDDDATRIWAGVAGRLWRPPPPGHQFRLLSDEAKRWARQLQLQFASLSDSSDRMMLSETVEAIAGLVANQGEQVVLHQDLHGGNILRAEREPWLAIDPKPLVGEREFDTEGFLCDGPTLLTQPNAGAVVQRRLDFLSDELGLDKRRMRLWGLVHTFAWGFSRGRVIESHLQAARLIWRTKV